MSEIGRVWEGWRRIGRRILVYIDLGGSGSQGH
jgi:hypothetical protein